MQRMGDVKGGRSRILAQGRLSFLCHFNILKEGREYEPGIRTGFFPAAAFVESRRYVFGKFGCRKSYKFKKRFGNFFIFHGFVPFSWISPAGFGAAFSRIWPDAGEGTLFASRHYPSCAFLS